MNIITAPQDFSAISKDRHEVFLAWSIEMGRALDWQWEMIESLQDYIDTGRLRTYNPRRPDWDTSWSQDDAHPELKKQIQWELRALKRADTIIFYFDPNTLSPITLLEFGKYVDSGKCIIYCPRWFWRRANILVTAEESWALVVETIQDIVKQTILRITTERYIWH
jgi:Nucleoside 2-deoxyribosyltransferase like